MVVRRLEAGDEAVACKAVATFKNSHPTDDYMTWFLSNKDNYLYVAELEGELAGFLLAYKLERCDGERAMMFLYEVEVLSQYRRQGIGRSLVEAVRRECEQGRMLMLFHTTNLEFSTPCRAEN
jgi:ribosomal protein S18 acetylase RimI-like enzyme